jgi:hypothetical protein
VPPPHRPCQTAAAPSENAGPRPMWACRRATLGRAAGQHAPAVPGSRQRAQDLGLRLPRSSTRGRWMTAPKERKQGVRGASAGGTDKECGGHRQGVRGATGAPGSLQTKFTSEHQRERARERERGTGSKVEAMLGMDENGRVVVRIKQLVQCARNVGEHAASRAMKEQGAAAELAHLLGHGAPTDVQQLPAPS